jgi:hypothetical protein
MAHGDRLHPNVVHVPMLASVPGGFEFPASGPVSAIDLFPTIAELAAIGMGYRGYGRSWLGTGAEFEQRWVLSELDSLYGVGFLNKGNLQTPHQRVTSRTAIGDKEIEKYSDGIREWCLCDGTHFYREDEHSAQHVLREMASGNDLECDHPQFYRSFYRALLERSAYKDMQVQDVAEGDAAVLEERLRDLGYIE